MKKVTTAFRFYLKKDKETWDTLDDALFFLLKIIMPTKEKYLRQQLLTVSKYKNWKLIV